MSRRKVTTKEYVYSIFEVGKTAFRIAPSVMYVRLFDSLAQSILPLATTYFAALTTTALADAYAGDQQAADSVFTYVILTAVVSVLTLVWSSISFFMLQKTRYRVQSTVEDQLMLHFARLSFELYDDKEMIDLYAKAERFSYFFSYIFDTFGRMVTSIIGVVVAVVALVVVSPWLTLIVLVSVIPGMVIQLKLARAQTKHWQGSITKRRRKNHLGYALSERRFITEMRIYGVIQHLQATYGRLRDEDEKERLQFELKTTWKQLVADIGKSIVELGALVWVVIEIVNRQQPVGQFVYVQQMVSRAMSEADSFARQLGSVDEDLANIVDYHRFMDLPEVVEKGKTLSGQPSEIMIDRLTFRYPKTQKDVLKDVSIKIRRGEHVAIVGENGAGKSTLIRLIMGLYPPTEGGINLDGKPLSSYSLASWHHLIGLLHQDFMSYDFADIKENITLGDVAKRPTKELIRGAMDQAEFSEVVDALDHGDRTYINRWMAEDSDEATATELSGGQEQRLALARNFYRDAPIMILDEPTSAIDALAETRIFNRLFASDKTIIAVSHRFSTIKKADVVYMMEHGRVVEVGTARELVAEQGKFYRMFESQIK